MASYNSHFFLTNEFGIRRGWKCPPPCHPCHLASWLCQWAHVLSAPSCRDDSGVKVWAAVIRVSIPVRDCLLHLLTAESGIQEESSYVRPCVVPCDCYNYSFSKFMNSSCEQHGSRHWTYNDVQWYTMMYREDSLSITFYNNILDFFKSINV